MLQHQYNHADVGSKDIRFHSLIPWWLKIAPSTSLPTPTEFSVWGGCLQCQPLTRCFHSVQFCSSHKVCFVNICILEGKHRRWKNYQENPATGHTKCWHQHLLIILVSKTCHCFITVATELSSQIWNITKCKMNIHTSCKWSWPPNNEHNTLH
jgi:hypothetical protein